MLNFQVFTRKICGNKVVGLRQKINHFKRCIYDSTNDTNSLC